MTKMPSMLKTLLVSSYLLVFLAGLGAFCSTMGCAIDKNRQAIEKKETAPKPQLPIMNPMQMLGSKFF